VAGPRLEQHRRGLCLPGVVLLGPVPAAPQHLHHPAEATTTHRRRVAALLVERHPVGPDVEVDEGAVDAERGQAHLRRAQRGCAADFAARFSALAASAPWQRFTLEVNPLKLGRDDAAAVDGLLIID